MTPKRLPLTLEIRDHSFAADSAVDKAIRRLARAISLRLTRLGPQTAGSAERCSKCIKSIGSQRIFTSAIVGFGRFLELNRAGSLKRFPSDAPAAYLFARSRRVEEAQLLLDRWALHLLIGKRLPQFEPSRPQLLRPRAYTSAQIAAIAARQTPPNAFSTMLAAAVGLRTMELLTIARLDEQPIDTRPWPALTHFMFEPSAAYSVYGKGGLIRAVRIPCRFVEQLEASRRPSPVRVRHSGRDLRSFYQICGGTKWGDSFSEASKREFGDSAGGHGLRHSYVQDRVEFLTTNGVVERAARAAVAAEVGHFRTEIIDTYLRGRWSPSP